MGCVGVSLPCIALQMSNASQIGHLKGMMLSFGSSRMRKELGIYFQ